MTDETDAARGLHVKAEILHDQAVVVVLGSHEHRRLLNRGDGRSLGGVAVGHGRLDGLSRRGAAPAAKLAVVRGVLAPLALAVLLAQYASLEALAVLLEARALLAVAPLLVLTAAVAGDDNLVRERLRVPKLNLLPGHLHQARVVARVLAVLARALVAKHPRGEALAVQLQALGLLAVALLALAQRIRVLAILRRGRRGQRARGALPLHRRRRGGGDG